MTALTADWSAAVVEADGTHVARLDLLPGGSITLGDPDERDVPNRCDLLVGPVSVSLRGRYLAVRYSRDSGPGEWFLPGSAPRALSEASEELRLTGTDLTKLAALAGIRDGRTFPAGAFVRESAQALLNQFAPRLQHSIGDNDGTLVTPLAYDPGATVLTAVQELLTAGGMQRLRPTPGGGVTSGPWIPPAERGSRVRFAPGLAPDTAPYLAPMDVPDDHTPAVNEVLARTRGSSDAPGVVGRWADELAIASYGPVTRTIDVDATDLAAATLLARQEYERLQPARTMRFTGAWQPVRPGDVVTVDWPYWGVTGRWLITGMRIDLSPAADTTYDLVEVIG